MISLFKSIQDDAEQQLKSALEAYCAALATIGQAGAQVCPQVGESLQTRLLELQAELARDSSSAKIAETSEQFDLALKNWCSSSSEFLRDTKTSEVREILSLVAETASRVSERDERHEKQLRQFTNRLAATAQLDDIRMIRDALSRDVEELDVCAKGIAQDGIVAELKEKLNQYEARLEEVELIASHDALTGLANRRKVGRQLDIRIRRDSAFWVIYLDLNNFKQINDHHGHQAGDDLLRQFAGELKAALGTKDVIGRWGGDEFIVLVDGDYQAATARLRRIEQWVNGEYCLLADSKRIAVTVSAAAGMAERLPGMSANDILSNADRAMYTSKSQMSATRSRN